MVPVQDLECFWSLGVEDRHLHIFNFIDNDNTKNWIRAQVSGEQLVYMSPISSERPVPKVARAMECEENLTDITLICKDEDDTFHVTLNTAKFISCSALHKHTSLIKLGDCVNSAKGFTHCLKEIAMKLREIKEENNSRKDDAERSDMEPEYKDGEVFNCDDETPADHLPGSTETDYMTGGGGVSDTYSQYRQSIEAKQINGEFDIPLVMFTLPNKFRQDRPVNLQHVQAIKADQSAPNLTKIVGIVSGCLSVETFDQERLSADRDDRYSIEVVGGTHSFLAQKDMGATSLLTVLYCDMGDTDATFLATVSNQRQHNIKKNTFAENVLKARRHWLLNGKKEKSKVIQKVLATTGTNIKSISHEVKVATLDDDMWHTVEQIFLKYPAIPGNKFAKISGSQHHYKELLGLILEGKNTGFIVERRRELQNNGASKRKTDNKEQPWLVDINEREEKLMKLDQHLQKKIEEVERREIEVRRKLDDISAREITLRQKEKNFEIKHKLFVPPKPANQDVFTFGGEDTYGCEDNLTKMIYKCKPSPAVDAVWQSSDNMYLGSIGPNVINFSSIQSLKPGQKLTDEVISASLSLICGMEKARNKKIKVADTIVFTNMLVRGKFESGQVRGQKDSVIKIMEEDDEYIFGIINTGDHWCAVCWLKTHLDLNKKEGESRLHACGVIDVEEKTLLLLNPLGEKEPQTIEILKNWNNYSSKIGAGVFKSITKSHLMQEDYNSCGVVSLLLLERLIKDEELSDPKDTNQYRCDLAERILEATVHFLTKCHVCNAACEDNKMECIVCGRACHTACVNEKPRCTLCDILDLQPRPGTPKSNLPTLIDDVVIMDCEEIVEEVPSIPVQSVPKNQLPNGQLIQVEWTRGQTYLAWKTDSHLICCSAAYGNIKNPEELKLAPKCLKLNLTDKLTTWKDQYVIGIVSPNVYDICNLNISPKADFSKELATNTITYLKNRI